MPTATVFKKKMLTPAGAESVLAAAEAFALEKGYRVVIAVVDDAGIAMNVKRLPGTQAASTQVGIDKARTAAIFVRPSRVLEEQVTAGRFGALALAGAAALTGGIPLVVDGQVVGAIGTSGETPDEDEAVSIVGSEAEFETEEVYALGFAGARLCAQTAAAVAKARGVAPVISVVDRGGELIYQWRPDEAQVASVKVAQDKARTAAIFRRPSKDFEDQAGGGRPSALALAGGVPLQGGIPIEFDGQVVGGIGVSGASSAPEDSELAMIGAKAAESFSLEGHAQATYIPAADVTAKFEVGGFMVTTGAYIVDAGRRTAAGQAEWHARDTDIMYIQEGTATMVTDGTINDPQHTADGELRGESIENGVTHELKKGDIIIIPDGVPHHFIEVSDPFLYYVVKVLD
ncbi:MAG: hypothetical protein GYB68_09905 [Chloroflexi bacterium]|nr:hypothetical protein [Chloroflexota bacterium]